MQVQVKYFYTDGAEMKQHDLVFLEGFENDTSSNFSGFCRLAFINSEKLSVYPLGQTIDTNSTIELYLEDIEKLVKVDSKEIDEALNKAVKRL